MYIPPQTKIFLLSGVPLDDTYEHTIYFDSITAQNYYFIGGEGHRPSHYVTHVTGQSFQDPNDNVIRCEINYKDILNCNYMCFNAGHYITTLNPDNQINVNKWYYCFVKKIRYVNNNVTEIMFSVDVMQTYFFDYDLKDCFVERQHAETDDWFANTVYENLDLGNEFVCYDQHSLKLNTGMDWETGQYTNYEDSGLYLVALVNRRRSGGDVDDGLIMNNVYSSTRVHAFPYLIENDLNITQAIDAFLDEYNENDIIALYEYPRLIRDMYGYNLNHSNDGRPEIQVRMPKPGLEFINGPEDKNTSFEYIARNKKLCTFPYTKLVVTNNAGDMKEYKYEYFPYYTDGNLTYLNFKGWCSGVNNPAFTIFPEVYRGVEEDYENSLTIDNFPMCSWSGDTFKTWYAQNKNQIGVLAGMAGGIGAISAVKANMGAAMVEGVTQFAQPTISYTGRVLPDLGPEAMSTFMRGESLGLSGAAGVIGALGSIAMNLAKRQDVKNMPSNLHGTAQNSNITAGYGRYKFNFFEMKVKKEYAIIIDQFFSRFGYAMKTIRTPNRHARQNWTYIKTADCAITETVANDVAEQICSIYNKGITFWMSSVANKLGHYNEFNDPNDENDRRGFYNPPLNS